MRLLHRAGFLSVLLPVALVAGSAPASADLDDYLAEAEDAEYTGRQVVVTFWNDESEVGVFDVTHVEGLTTINEGERSSMSDGRVADSRDGAAVVLEGWSRLPLETRYTTADPVAVSRLGRTAESVDVLEAGQVRATIVFDLESRVPLLTEIFDGEGELFRYSAMLEFDPNPSVRYADLVPAAGDYEVLLPIESSTLPLSAAGYVRADTYGAPDDTVQAFYTDGLFKFSIFEIQGEVALDRFEAAQPLETNDAVYLQLVTPSELWVMWATSGSTFVLVGDLPPDHLAQVLGELPAPENGGLFSRIWNGIFG